MQIQRAINDTRRLIRVVSSKTIGHLKVLNTLLFGYSTILWLKQQWASVPLLSHYNSINSINKMLRTLSENLLIMQNDKIDSLPSKWYNEESEYLTSKTKQKIVLNDPSSRAAATQHATQCDVASRSLFISVLLAILLTWRCCPTLLRGVS